MTQNLNELFHELLKDVYYAEKQLVNALPKMAENSDSDELKQAFSDHHKETQEHVKRLEQVFAEIDEKPTGKQCEAMDGLIAEGQEVMSEADRGPVLDAGLIASAQAVEHYEIARYGTLCAWAKQLGLEKAEETLRATLDEERNADALLTEIAEADINQAA